MSLLTPLKDMNPNLNTLKPYYFGKVVDNNDPLGLQRVKVKIIELFGTIETSNLPWCIKDNCAGDSNSTGFIGVPSVGQIVKVSFDCNDIYSPTYSMGFINSVPSSFSTNNASGYIDSLSNFFRFDANGITLSDTNNNTIVMNADGIKITDKNNNSIVMNSSGITVNGNNLIKLDATTTQITGDETIGGNSTISGNMHSPNYDAHTHTGNLGNPTSAPDQ